MSAEKTVHARIACPAVEKVAIVHDWLTVLGGAERVLEQLLIAYPDADVYTICDFVPEHMRGFLRNKIPSTSFIQDLPFAKGGHWRYLPLMPLAIEQFDLSGYDLVISSSYFVAKGVLTGPGQLHISYIHTPVRYAWHLQHQYLHEMGLTQGLRGFATRLLLHYFRMWDLRSAVGVDAFISNSSYVAAQVKKLYRRDCTVLYPPIDLSRFRLETVKEDYYVTASRLVPYKRIDMIVNAFRQMPNRRLIVIGDGPERLRIGRAAKDQANIQILGYQSDDQLTHYVGKAKAFVFAAVEDFGIAPLEAQASGTPVIALGRGGVCETIRPLGVTDPTGVLYPLQTEASLIVAIELFEASASHITPEACRQNAERFSADRFQAGLCALIHSARSDRGLIEVDAAQASGEVSGRRFYADSSEADTRDLLATDRRAANHNFNGTAD